jgi:transcriptional regulator with XRE-family HTH domain
MKSKYEKKIRYQLAKQGLTLDQLGQRLTDAKSKRLGRECQLIGRSGALMAVKSPNPRATSLHDMAAALGVSVGYFFDNNLEKVG